jgi:hypothetical protein
MGHLKTTATTLLLAFVTITCQGLSFQSESFTTKNSDQYVNVNSTDEYSLANTKDHRGSGR